MKVLLVNNNTRHLEHLHAALAGHEIEELRYQPGVEFNYSDKDLIVLSGGGGEGLEIDDRIISGKLWYQDQMEFIQNCSKPIFGICMGFEVIARTFGASVKKMSGGLVEGFTDVKTTQKGLQKLNRRQIRQWEAHEWHVPAIDQRQFDVLAVSSSGLEIIKHKTRPILATQFHPEKGGTLSLRQLADLTL